MSGRDDKRAASVPADLGHQAEDKDILMDQEFDKIFHDDRFDPKTLNPAGTGNVDEGRNYYRSASGEPGEGERRGDEGRGSYSSDTPVQGHDRHEYPQSRSIMSKKKKGAGKRRPSEQARHDLPSIPGDDGEGDDTDGEDHEESSASLPWKSKGDAPVMDSHNIHAPVPDAGVAPEGKEEERRGGAGGVKFTLGHEDDDDEEEDYSGHRQYRRPSSQLKKVKKEADHSKRAGSDMKGSEPRSLAEEDDDNLRDPDREDIGVHRFEKAVGMGRHKIKKASTHGDLDYVPDGKTETGRSVTYGFKKDIDHTPHNLFVEMDELEGEMWVEKARWIKYEEDLEAEAGRWGKPHVSSLTFRSLLNVRKSLEHGTMLLDIMETDLPAVMHRVVEQLSVEGIIEEENKPEILRTLNYRHKYVHPHNSNFRFGMKKSGSNKSLPGFFENRDSKKKGASVHYIRVPRSEGMLEGWHRASLPSNKQDANGYQKDSNSLVLEMGDGPGLKRTGSGSNMKRSDTAEAAFNARKADILSCLEEGTEGCITLVGSIKTEKTICAFIRLGTAIVMHNTIEVNLPMRFIFCLLTPQDEYRMDPHEIGRSFSTLMSNNSFHNVCYKIEGKRELLHAINVFLDDSVVLPPGDWNKQKLLAMTDIMNMRKRKEERKEAAIEAGFEPPEEKPEPEKKETPEEKKEKKGEEDGEETPKRNPLVRTKIPFGGLIDDIKCRYPQYLSDIKDGLNSQVIAATIFIYFAALSGAIAFGGLMATKTKNDIGIPETLICSAVAGVIFALFSGCPLIIIGTTGPVLLYDEALFGFSESMTIEFLPWRAWIGIWTLIIALVVAGFQGSTLVKHFTKFTKDIFAALVALLFIFEAFNKLFKIFKKHPLLSTGDYCETHENATTLSVAGNTSTSPALPEEVKDGDVASPNTALLSAILMLGTFFIAYFLRIFRNSKVFGRNARRALGDFGVPIAIVIMVLMDFAFTDTYTEKLNVPEGLQVTNSTSRGWFISPIGNKTVLPVWSMFAAFLPAILLYLLLFMETHICELIMLEKTKGEKGVGIHLDIVILAAINSMCGLFGGPWICAATVRAVSHLSALMVVAPGMPGESPRMVGVRDQRVSAFTVSILLGLSVLMAPILKLVPFAVLFGVFLYMGVSGMNGVQFFDRLMLCVMPVKHHPQVSYVVKVKTWRMVMFTAFQGLGLVVLWIVKSTPAAIAFPFFVIAMIPYRHVLRYIFTPMELDMLDGPQAGKDLSGAQEDEVDFFETAGDVPIVPHSAVPLHRSIMQIMALPGVTLPAMEKTE